MKSLCFVLGPPAFLMRVLTRCVPLMVLGVVVQAATSAHEPQPVPIVHGNPRTRRVDSTQVAGRVDHKKEIGLTAHGVISHVEASDDLYTSSASTFGDRGVIAPVNKMMRKARLLPTSIASDVAANSGVTAAEVGAGLIQESAAGKASSFSVGQHVQFRDAGQPWKNGVVSSLYPVRVQPDGMDTSRTWDEVEALRVSAALPLTSNEGQTSSTQVPAAGAMGIARAEETDGDDNFIDGLLLVLFGMVFVCVLVVLGLSWVEAQNKINAERKQHLRASMQSVRGMARMHQQSGGEVFTDETQHATTADITPEFVDDPPRRGSTRVDSPKKRIDEGSAKRVSQ